MGGKGGPLAFLNKKGWHPGNQRNQEKVWKKEQEALAEKKQIEEIRKQYEEARQKEEMEAMAVAAGVKKKQERLDWMYQGGMVAKQEAQKRADAHMMGETQMELPQEEAPSKADEVAALPTFYTTDNAASANEMWSRLHGDPMFAIKQQEITARKNLVANPVQMDAIRKAVQQKKQAKEARKAAKKEAKLAKKAKKDKKSKKEKKRKRVDSDSSDSSDTDAGRDNKKGRLEQEVDPPARAQQLERESSPAHDRRHREMDSNGHRQYDRRDSDRRYDDRNTGRDRDYRRGAERSSADRREGHRPDGKSYGRSDWERRDHRDRDDHRQHRDRQNDENGHRAERHRADDGPAHRENGRIHDKENGVKVHHDSASAQGRDLTYGLNKAEAQDFVDRDERRRETAKRLDDAARRKAAEEKEKASQRYQRKEHKTGKLTEEEQQRRLAEMTGNANVHEEARWARLHAARQKDNAQEDELAALKEKALAAHAAPGTKHHETARFLDQAAKDIYSASDASAADRIARRKYYNHRGADDEAGAFRR